MFKKALPDTASRSRSSDYSISNFESFKIIQYTCVAYDTYYDDLIIDEQNIVPNSSNHPRIIFIQTQKTKITIFFVLMQLKMEKIRLVSIGFILSYF